VTTFGKAQRLFALQMISMGWVLLRLLGANPLR